MSLPSLNKVIITIIISPVHAHVFRTAVLIVVKKKKCTNGNKRNRKLDPRVYAAFPLTGESHYVTNLKIINNGVMSRCGDFEGTAH